MSPSFWIPPLAASVEVENASLICKVSGIHGTPVSFIWHLVEAKWDAGHREMWGTMSHDMVCGLIFPSFIIKINWCGK